MKNLLIIFFLLMSCFSGFAQDYLSIANNCYKQGDYECARDNYKLVPNNETAMLLRSKAVLCLSYLSDAEDSFKKGNFQDAKENYEAILKINPDDANAISQIKVCDENMKPNANSASSSIPTQSTVSEESATSNASIPEQASQEIPQQITTPKYEADSCFKKGEYDCAQRIYNDLKSTATEKDKRFIETRLTLINSCVEHLKIANEAFDSGDFSKAIENYQLVLDDNKDDPNAKKQKDLCQEKQRQTQSAPPAIAATPPSVSNQVTTLSVSSQNVYFPASGETQNVTVTTNAGSYDVELLPSWCSVEKNYNGFFVICTANPQSSGRQDWFYVYAGDKKLRINVSQKANYSSKYQNNSTKNYTPNNRGSYKSNSCFNCPTAKYSWGLTVGYISKYIDYGLDNSTIDYSGIDNKMDGITVGLRFEPLFKYGFGLNTGLNYEYYSKSFNYNESIAGYDDNVSYNYQEHALNIPLHLEYRLNFSKYFNIFAYGGLGLDVVTDSSFGNFTTNALFEYGGGLRIDHVQFNIGRSNIIKNLSGSQNVYYNMNNKYKDWIISISYMFK